MRSAKPIYLDHAATTPVDKDVLKEMTPYFREKFGNPSSLHNFGQEAVRALDTAREKAARAVHADFREIIFTGSATEANNLALRGTLKGYSHWGIGFRKKNGLVASGYTLNPRVIVSPIEHESVLETARDLEREGVDPVRNHARAQARPEGPGRAISNGVEVMYLPVNKNGIVDVKKLKESLDEHTILVSVMYGNNVTGAIQPIAEISEIIRNFREKKASLYPKSYILYPLLHTDAAQCFQYLDCDVNTLGVDLMTLSSHKVYGPKGVGLLYVRATSHWGIGSRERLNPSGYTLNPITTGGGQEFNMRSGTENIPAIVGFAKAMEMAEETKKPRTRTSSVRGRQEKLKNYFWKKLKRALPEIKRNPDEKTPTLPHILNIRIPNAPKNFVALLDAKGVAVSSGAACSTRSAKPSYVLLTMGFSEKEAGESIRLSLGKPTTKAEIDEAVRRMKAVLGQP